MMWRFPDVAWVQRRPDRERHTAAQAKANLVPVQRARPGDNDCLNSVMGLPAPLRILSRLTSGNRQPCRLAALS